MMLASVVLAAVLLPAAQEPVPPAAPTPQDASAVKGTDLPASYGAAGPHIDAGLVAFKKRHFNQAEGEFRKALDLEPQSAAAAFYLGYTYYKIAEPKRPNDPGKQRAAELFAKAYAIDSKFQPVWKSSK